MKTKAQWITSPVDPAYSVVSFRSSFQPKKTIKKATVYATAMGVYAFFLNGERIGRGVLAPAGRATSIACNTRPMSSPLSSNPRTSSASAWEADGRSDIWQKKDKTSHNHRLSRWLAQPYKGMLLAGAESPLKCPTLANLPYCHKCGDYLSLPCVKGAFRCGGFTQRQKPLRNHPFSEVNPI